MRRTSRTLVLLALAFAAACAPSSSPIDTSGLGASRDDIDQYINGLPDLPLADAQAKTEIECQPGICPQTGQEGDSFCTYKRYTETVQFDEFVAFQPNSATLWPGVVVRGADAEEGLLSPIGAELAPVTFSFSLENLANSPVGTMDKPSLSAFREARNAILAGGVTGATPASLDFDIVQVHSESQIGVYLGADVSWPGGPEIAASFDFSSTQKRTKVLVNFTQAYYTVDVDAPATPKDFFDPKVTLEDLKPYISESSPPLYVQSITYGRRVIFSVETDSSAQQIQAALEAAYQGVVDVGVEVSAEHKQVIDSSTIHAFVIGGAAGEATGIISGFDGLMQYIQSGGDFSADSPGAPIAYKVAYLDHAVTKLAFTTEYSERECVKNQGPLRVRIVALDHLAGTDAGGNMEFYGAISVRHPTVAGDVISCAEGGAEVDVWRLDEGSWLSFPELTRWEPESPTFIDLSEVPVGQGRLLCLKARLMEEDSSTGELSGDDDFGSAELLIPAEIGWPGEHVLHLQGSGENRIDVILEVSQP